jgi:hypothetical protein
MISLRAALAAVVCVLAGWGRAEAQEIAPAPAPASPAAVSPAAAVEARDDDAWTAYHRAFRALLTGNRAGGVAALEAIETDHPGHPAAVHAASLLRIVRAAPGPPALQRAEAVPKDEEVSAEQRPSRGARAELVIFQTVHGVILGAEICAVVDCQGVRPHALALLGGGVAGIGASLFGSSGGVTRGQVELLDTGTLWGAWNGFEISMIADQDTGSARFWQTMIAGQSAGLVVGGLLWYPLRPTSGQVTLASTVGTWGTVLTAFGVEAVDSSIDRTHLWTTLLAAGDLGLLAGAIAARDSQISVGRSLLIDAGGVLGLLLGALVVSGNNGQRTEFAVLFGGAAIGVTTAAVATRDWDAPTPNVRAMAMPLPGGGVAASLGGAF